MDDREFIKILIKAYLSNAKNPHQATLDNTFANRLNDIADKLEKREKVLKWLFEFLFLEPKQIADKYYIKYMNREEGNYILEEVSKEDFDIIKNEFERINKEGTQPICRKK